MGFARTGLQPDQGFGGRRENGSAPMPGSVPGCAKAGLQDPQTSTETKKYDVPQGTSQITIKVSGGVGCSYGYKKIYVNGRRYSFGTFTIPSYQWRNNGQLKIYVYDYCSSSGGSYYLEIQFTGTGVAFETPISDWEKISIPLDAAKGKTAWFRFSATNNYKASAWNIDDLTITPNPVPAPKPKISNMLQLVVNTNKIKIIKIFFIIPLFEMHIL